MIGRVTILLVFVFQVFNSFCSRKVYSERTSPDAEKKVAKKQFEENVQEAGMFSINVPAAIKTSVSLKENAGSDNISVTATSPEAVSLKYTADEIVNTARTYIGVPHCWRRPSPVCMDCSGLLVTVFGKYGIQLPHNSEAQSAYGKRIEKDELRKGDLVFFIRSYNTTRYITHSGIYIGNGRFIHTSSSRGVTITSLNDPWWKEKFIFGTRILE